MGAVERHLGVAPRRRAIGLGAHVPVRRSIIAGDHDDALDRLRVHASVHHRDAVTVQALEIGVVGGEAVPRPSHISCSSPCVMAVMAPRSLATACSGSITESNTAEVKAITDICSFVVPCFLQDQIVSDEKLVL